MRIACMEFHRGTFDLKSFQIYKSYTKFGLLYELTTRLGHGGKKAKIYLTIRKQIQFLQPSTQFQTMTNPRSILGHENTSLHKNIPFVSKIN